MYSTKFHRDGTFTIWNVYEQRWVRLRNPSDRLLATLSEKEREKINAIRARTKENF